MILVTGANGGLGRRIVEHLVARLGETKGIAVSVREPAQAADLASRGISVRRGNFDEPHTLPRAFSGVNKLVLVSTDGPRDLRIAQHRTAINAAKEAGVTQILYTSFVDTSADSPSEFAAVHRATEEYLSASGLKITRLRNTLYADLLPMAFAAALSTGILSLPAGTGRASLVSRDELAQAIAAAAAAPALAKEVYELTGQSAHDYHEITAAVAKVVGRPIRFEPVSEDAYVDVLASGGLPAWLARAVGNMYSAVAAGKFAKVSNDYAALVGRPPRPLACLAQELFGTR